MTPDVFPAKASPTVDMHFHSGTGFSREEASLHTLNPAARHPTSSRLKPFLRSKCISHSGTGFSREEASLHTLDLAA